MSTTNNVKLKLTVMNFLEFAVWGAYLISMGNYLGTIGLGSKIGLFYAMQGVVSIFMPAIMGIIADRWIPVQRLLGINHLLAAVFIILTGYYGYSSGEGVNFTIMFSLYSLSVAFFMPTIALSNSAAYTILKQNNLDTIKAFPPIRTLGTVGFICAMLLVDFMGFQSDYRQFYVSGGLGIILFLYSFVLPNCPISKSNEKQSLADAFGLKAFALFKNKNGNILHIFYAFRCIASDYKRICQPLYLQL